MSAYMCNVLDFGGVACMSCAPPEPEKYHDFIKNVPETRQHLQNPSQIPPIVETRTSDSYSILNETNIGMMGPGAPAHAVGPTPEIGEQFHGASLYGADLFHEDDMYSQIEEETSGWNLLYPHNLPEITSGRLPEININSKPALIPLFEKVLVPSDADPCRGMLFLPKLYSEIYFPELPLGQKMPLLVQDITGVNWQFVYGVWWMNGRKIYVLEGFDGYMTLMGLKPGDKVTFYRTEPEKKLKIRLQKAPDNK